MGDLFSIFGADELLRVAIKQEQYGEQFYNEVASGASDPKAKEIFENLAEAERQHTKAFTALAEKLPSGKSLDSERGQFEDYADALLETCVFAGDNAGQQLARSATTDLEAVEAGIAFEKDTIIFMQEMCDYAKGEALPIIQAVLKQEKQHVVSLAQFRRSLLQPA